MENQELLDFYSKNLEKLDDAWYNHCFMEGRFKNPKESAREYQSHNAFWRYVGKKFQEAGRAAA